MTEAGTTEAQSAAWAVPAFETHEFSPRRHRYCVVVFVINEGARVLRQLEGMASLADEVDIILADGGSTDGSTEQSLLIARRVRTLLVKTGPGRLSSQMRMAFAYALRSGYDGVITIDGNDKDDPSAVPAFVKALDDGCDHVQGSRFMAGGHHANTPPLRLLGVRLLHAPLISLAAGFRYTDTTNGFRAYSRRFLVDARVSPFREVFSAYELHYYLAIRAAELGFRVTEVPVTRSYPPKGPTPTRISPIRGNVKILRTLWRAVRHRFDPQNGGRG